MGLTWRKIEGEQILQTWDRVCQVSKSATFFHTRAWADVLQATFLRWAPVCIAIEYSDGNLAILPRMERMLAPGLAYSESMLPGVYGGPLFQNPPSEAHWGAVWDGAYGRVLNTILYGNPFLSYIGHPKSVERSMSTQVLDLSQGFDNIWKGMRVTHRQNIRTAEKKGIQVGVATDLESVDAYVEIYQDALGRWGKTASGFYPRRLFHNFFGRPEYGNAVKLWVARANASVVGGAWMFYHNDHAVDWYSLVHSDYMDYGVMPHLLSTAIQDACGNGLRWFDFNPSGGHKGVEDFKAGFGAQRRKFCVYRRLNPWGKAFRLYRHLKERYLRVCGL